MRLSISYVLAGAVLCGAMACPATPDPTEDTRTFHADPERIDFGFAAAGGSTDPIAIDLINATTSTVEIQNILVAVGSDAFSLFSQPTTLPVELAPGDDLQISAYFAPPESDMYLGTIQILTSDEGDMLEIDIGGCSTDPDCEVVFEDGDDDDATDDDDAADDDDATDDDDVVAGDGCISVDPSPMSFGQQPQNGSPVQDLLNITNDCDGVLTVSNVALSGADASQFSTGGFSGGDINPGVTIPLAVVFTPVGSLGNKAATITINSNASNDTSLDVPINAEVIEDCGDCLPLLEVVGAAATPNPIGFGPDPLIHLGGLSAGPTTVTIRNSGWGTISVSSITEGGTVVADNPEFAYTGGSPLPFNLNSSEEATLDITIGSAGCEVINFDGVYAFSVGIPTDAFGCFGR
jgi:hypothetical protein